MFGNFVLRTFVGVIVYLVVGTMVAGSAAGQLLAVTVICTAGVGLVVVIPACYLIGLLCTVWFIPFEEDHQFQPTKRAISGNVPPSGAGSEKRTIVSERSQTALEDYMVAELSRGMVWYTVHNQCVSAGWPEDAIKAAYEMAKRRSFHEGF